MRAVGEVLGGMGKPLVVVALVLLGLGLVSADPAKGRTGADGFHCRGWTDDAAWNRTICRYHPARIWTMPVSDLLPDGVRLEDPATWF